MQFILQSVPSASRTLSSVLASAFPYEAGSKRAHAVYVRNLLKILAYVPELKAEVLGLITERLVKIDVQVQVDLEDLAEDVGDGLVRDIPRINSTWDDEDGSESSDDESVASDGPGTSEARQTREIIKNVEKMDILLDLLFEYYTEMSLEAATNRQVEAIDILLSQFTTIILPAHRSRHTQFLLFHFVQSSATLIDTFVGTCVQSAFDKVQPAVIRQTAAAYLASFVARGQHVQPEIVRDVFDLLRIELERLRSASEPTCRGPDLRRYLTFYSLVQAVLYIFCFRWRDLQYGMEEDSDNDEISSHYQGEHHWRPGVKETLTSNLFSKMNPLKVCSPVIVAEFARIARHLGVMYVYHILEINKRVRISQSLGSSRSATADGFNPPDRQTALSARRDEHHQHFDEYFPFDPYHLPRSKRWIEGDYRVWTGVPGLDDEPAIEGLSDEDGSMECESEGETAIDDSSDSH